MNRNNTCLFFILLFVPVSNALAYVDGGTGMLLIQGFIALIGGAIFFLKNPIKVIKSWIERFRK